MNTDRAEAIALDVLIWLSQDVEMLQHFLSASGLSPDDLRAGWKDPGLLGGVLDFVLMSDEAVFSAARHVNVEPEAIGRARAALPGGFTPNWT